MIALAAGLRHAGRGSRGRERERVRGSLAAGGMWFGHRASLTPGGLRDGQPILPTPRASRSPVALTGTAHAMRSTRTAHARRPFGLLGILCVWAVFSSSLARAQDDAAEAPQRLRPPSLSVEPEASRRRP